MLNALNEAINNMVDYQHAELIVDRIEYDGDDIYNVMQETDNIHLDNVSSLTDESGQVYNLYLCNTRRGSSSERRIYAIQFEDNPALPIGTVLTVGPQYWRKEIPKSKPIKIEYERSIFILDMKGGGFKLSVDLKGEISFSKSSVGDFSNNEVIQTVSPSICKDFLNEMLRCVSSKDCYNGHWADDTCRKFVIYFEDGSVLEYLGVYIHGEMATDNIVDEFITNLGLNCKPWT